MILIKRNENYDEVPPRCYKETLTVRVYINTFYLSNTYSANIVYGRIKNVFYELDVIFLNLLKYSQGKNYYNKPLKQNPSNLIFFYVCF